ncbi:hypothetical protein SCLCIDRAFT_173497 [Scleroderma citrinum Foug A]|uniref:Uncharacterized protein n=1 Tax=Scleroderma citrinum Foug A TaxID=1036808 RepID=A0A0C3ESP2_9AGAM|nr:hypothetical protein SCLCIDRAFT_173497 [Scleroderma citrinum Foug A]
MFTWVYGAEVIPFFFMPFRMNVGLFPGQSASPNDSRDHETWLATQHGIFTSGVVAQYHRNATETYRAKSHFFFASVM